MFIDPNVQSLLKENGWVGIKCRGRFMSNWGNLQGRTQLNLSAAYKPSSNIGCLGITPAHPLSQPKGEHYITLGKDIATSYTGIIMLVASSI